MPSLKLSDLALKFEAQTTTISDFINRYKAGGLNLSPGFQRRSVWTVADRRRCIDSILRGFPLPAIFVHKNTVDGDTVWNVIDGKQRLETVLFFTGSIARRGFSTASTPKGTGWENIRYADLKNSQQQHRILDYRLQVVFVDGDLSEVINLFVRLNSTGRPLNSEEKRHARYYDSHYLKSAAKLAQQFHQRFKAASVFSASDIDRMKHIEFVSEVMLSIHMGSVVHKKLALDSAMRSNALTESQVAKARAGAHGAIGKTLQMFPELRTTRFHKVTDFFSLVMVVHDLQRRNMILSDQRRNREAAHLLAKFGAGVDELRERQRKMQPVADLEEYRAYLQTVQEGTDTKNHRELRAKVLSSLFGSLFERKDPYRLFTPEQRRIVWQQARDRRCCFCKQPVAWEEFSVDHVIPHSKGGRTVLANAAIAHQRCNASAGAKVSAQAARA